MTINRKKEKEKGTLNETMSGDNSRPTNDDDDDDDESVFIHLILTGASGYLGQHLLAHWIETGLPQYYRKKTNHVHITALYNTFDGFPDAVKQFQDNLLSGGRDGNAGILDVTVHVQAMDISDPDKNNAFEILMDRITALPQTTTNDDDDDDNDGALQNSSTSSTTTTTTTCVIVIHTAAISSPKYCEDHPKQAYTDNVPTHFLDRIMMMGETESSLSSSSSTTLTPVAAATTNKQHKLVPSIIALSTDQVYDGKAKTFIMDNTDDTTPATGNWYKEEEQDAVNPVNVYGQTKLELEQYLIKKSSALSTTNSNLFFALRSSIIFGPNLVPILSSSTSSTSSSAAAATTTAKTTTTTKPLTSSSAKKRTKTVHTTFLDFVRSRGQQNLATTYYTNEYRTIIRVDDIQKIINDIITKHIIPTTMATSIVDTTSNYDNSSTSTSSMLMISSPPPVVFNMGGPYRVNRMDLAEAVFRYYGYDTQLLVPTEQTSSLSPKDISMDSSLLLHYGFGNKKITTMIKSLTKKANSSSNNNSTCSRDDGKGVHKDKEEEENMDHDHKNNNNNSKKSKLSKQEEYLDKLVRYVFS